MLAEPDICELSEKEKTCIYYDINMQAQHLMQSYMEAGGALNTMYERMHPSIGAEVSGSNRPDRAGEDRLMTEDGSRSTISC